MEQHEGQKVYDPLSGQTTTGHEWDGIRELNTPLPRWWLNIFYATIIWSFAYFILYPAWPLISSHTQGVLGYSSRGNVRAELESLQARRQVQTAALSTASLDEIRNDPTLLDVARAQGSAAFKDNCAPCHGAGGAGAIGYPNLNDDEWIWGGTLEGIHTTLLHGIRWENNEQTRLSAMPAFGRDGILTKAEVRTVSNHVRAIAGLSTEPGYDAVAGEALFTQNCAVCHGEAGAGISELGAPNLTNAIWLYGGEIENIVDMVTNARAGVMPAWSERLDAETVKALAVYVHSLGGGQPSP
jgi:cytochrome c oxidase cbb3-type subunit 3